MKKILVVILALVAVFCTFAGCNDAAKDNNTDNSTNVTDNTDKNTDNTDNSNNTDDTGNGENDGDTGEQNGNAQKKPITNGGSFNFDEGN